MPFKISTLLLSATVFGSLTLSATAANVAAFSTAEAISWRNAVVNIAPLMDYYKHEEYKGIWTSQTGLTQHGVDLIKLLKAAGTDGLESSDYLSNFPKNPNAMRGNALVGVELFLSEAAHKFARDLYAGRTTPSVSEPDIVIARKKLDIASLLGSFEKNGPKTVINRLRPKHSQYALLRKLLAETTDPAKRRKIIINLERWRWLKRDLGKNHVLVNSAGYLMFTRSNGKTIDTRKVIVGKDYHKTPFFSDNIKYSEFNPTWTVTPSIAGNEMLPKLKKDSSYLRKKGYDLYASWKRDAPKMNATQIDWNSVSGKRFPYKIVQPAGPKNALGQVKFLFPNKFNVYLHDTANRSLFGQQKRALSHGCIRVHEPLKFADLLYKLDNNPARKKIKAIVASKKTKGINFTRPIPVHLTYFTVWIGRRGNSIYYDDIYDRDKLIGNILFGRV